MNVRIRFPSFFAVSILTFAAGVLTPSPATAATLAMPNVPLPVNVGATSNIFFKMDDSKSMERDLLTRQHFTTCMYNAALNCNSVFMFEHMYDASSPESLEGVPEATTTTTTAPPTTTTTAPTTTTTTMSTTTTTIPITTGDCASWDLDCDAVCDWGESCPSGCSTGDPCICESWDTNCNGVCDFDEDCGTTGSCPSTDPDCNCPSSDPYCISRGDCPVSDPNCNCPWTDPNCVTGDPETCPSTDPNCNCPAEDPWCVTRGSCPVSDPNCCCPSWNNDCVTVDGGSCVSGGIASIASLINNYLAVSASVQPSASQRRRNSSETPTRISDGPPDMPESGGHTPPPSLPEDKRRRSRPQSHDSGDGSAGMTTFEYFFDSSGPSGSGCSSSADTYETCFDGTNEDSFDWRSRSSDLNVLYFNPRSTYEPWVGYADASFSSARWQPVSSLSGYTTTRNLDGFFYNFWIDDRGYSGSQPNTTNATNTGNNQIDQWDSHVKVTVTSLSLGCELFNYSPDSTGLNLQITPLGTSDSLCLEALGANPDLATLQQNVANYFQYYRDRQLLTKAALGEVVISQPDFRYGLSVLEDSNLFIPMPSASTTDFTAHNAQLIIDYQNHAITGGCSTCLRRAMEEVGDYFAGNMSGQSSPIIQACQKNFTILFTDGFWGGSDPGKPSSDFDGDGGTINSENVLVADVAKYYYDTDLAPQFDDDVVADDWDTATHQHLVTYTIGLGVSGRLTDTDGDGWPNDFDPFTYTGPWYLSGSSEDQKTVDDLWHAAWNGRGAFFSAQNPEQLAQALISTLTDIQDRTGTSASATANGGSLSELSQIFQSKYHTADWHGELLAFPVNAISGDLNAVSWEAGALLNAKSEAFFANQAGGRQMFTWDSFNNTGSTFTWVGLNAAQQAALDNDPDTGISDGEGQARVQYIRGSAVNEGTGNNYRIRINKLGDLVHSDLQFVKEPPFFYPFDSYQTFAATWADRTAIIYVGGNDGMLHAFRADTGAEVFAYVPNDVMPKLNQLTSSNYHHEFYVDGPMDYGDVYLTDTWKSVLVGSLRSGGQAVYALDITDPLNFSASKVLWEFTDENDPDLGFVMGRPQIKKMANGKWAVIVSSGYNNTDVDGAMSSSGNSYIFVLYIEEGMNGWSSGDYVKILVSGADGLSTPAIADVDGDGLSDFIYVGDINGNMWKIDVTNTSSSFWNVAFSGNPLFTATESIADGGSPQPITAQPAIKTHPLGIGHGVLVMWGTGKYYEISDDTIIDQPTQSIYAVWDRDGYYNLALNARNSYNERGFSRDTDLVSPKIIIDLASNTRIIDPDSLIDASGNPKTPVWYDADGNPDDRGWVVDLPEAGERVIQKIVLRDDLAFFVTLIPQESTCVPGSSGWLMVLNAETGSSPLFPVFDINDDNIVDSSDVLTVGDSLGNEITTQATGITMPSMPSLPVFLYDDRPADLGEVFPPSANSPRSCGSAGARTFTYTTQADGSMVKITTAPQPLACGRQNWIQQR